MKPGVAFWFDVIPRHSVFLVCVKLIMCRYRLNSSVKMFEKAHCFSSSSPHGPQVRGLPLRAPISCFLLTLIRGLCTHSSSLTSSSFLLIVHLPQKYRRSFSLQSSHLCGALASNSSKSTRLSVPHLLLTRATLPLPAQSSSTSDHHCPPTLLPTKSVPSLAPLRTSVPSSVHSALASASYLFQQRL